MSTKPTQKITLVGSPESSAVVVLHRRRARLLDVYLWNTADDTIRRGSQFVGKIYGAWLSPSGTWLAYTAIGGTGEVWTAICEPPNLTALVYQPHRMLAIVGAVWRSNGTVQIVRELNDPPGLVLNDRFASVAALPFKVLQTENLPPARAAHRGITVECPASNADMPDRFTLPDRSVAVAVRSGIERWTRQRRVFAHSFE